jgi:hypothetical protein
MSFYSVCWTRTHQSGKTCKKTSKSHELHGKNTYMLWPQDHLRFAFSGHAEYQSSDETTYTNPKNFYRCVKEMPDQSDTPVHGPGMCGGFGQHCCNSGSLTSQCGAGLTCNLGTPPCPRQHSFSTTGFLIRYHATQKSVVMAFYEGLQGTDALGPCFEL